MSRIDYTDQLLEMIRLEVGCSYLSDLHDPAWKGRIYAAVDAIPSDAFSLMEWNSAAYYITGRENAVESVEAAREELLAFLGEDE